MLYQCTMYNVQCTMYEGRFILLGSPTNFNSRVELAGVENYASNNRTPLGLRTRRGETR